MAPGADLEKVAMEGFGFVELLRRPRTAWPSHHTHLPRQIPPDREAIDAFEAARRHGGLLMIEHNRNKAQPSQQEAIDYKPSHSVGHNYIGQYAKIKLVRKSYY